MTACHDRYVLTHALGWPVVPEVSCRKHGLSSSTSRQGSSGLPPASSCENGVAQSGQSAPIPTKWRTVFSSSLLRSTSSLKRVSKMSAEASTWFSDHTWLSMAKWLCSTTRTRLCFSQANQVSTTSGVL